MSVVDMISQFGLGCVVGALLFGIILLHRRRR